MINVSELLSDPDFCQTFTVTRTSGSWVGGRWMPATPVTLSITGVITPMNTRDLIQIPEADRAKGAVNVYSTVPLNPTQLDASTGNTGSNSDEITWQGEQYKILQVQNFIDYGYYQATAVRKLGA